MCGDYLGLSRWALNIITSVLFNMEAEKDLTIEEEKAL